VRLMETLEGVVLLGCPVDRRPKVRLLKLSFLIADRVRMRVCELLYKHSHQPRHKLPTTPTSMQATTITMIAIQYGFHLRLNQSTKPRKKRGSYSEGCSHMT